MSKEKTLVMLSFCALAACMQMKSAFIVYEHLSTNPLEKWGTPGRGDLEPFLKEYFPNKKKLKVDDLRKKMESLRPDRDITAIGKAQVDQEIFWEKLQEIRLKKGAIKLKTGKGITEASETEEITPYITVIKGRQAEQIVPTKLLSDDDTIDLKKDSGHIHIWTTSKNKEGSFSLINIIDGKEVEQIFENYIPIKFFIDEKEVSEEEYSNFVEEHKKKE